MRSFNIKTPTPRPPVRLPSFFRRARGVTLIELLVSVVLIGALLSAVFTAFLAQNHLYRRSDQVREAQASARIALTTIDRYVRRAGFGVGAEVAFDFDRLGAGTTGAVRDQTDGPDQLAFVARSLNYFGQAEPMGTLPAVRGDAWIVRGVGAGSITIETNGAARQLLPGQVLFISCPQGFTYTYVTIRGGAVIPDTSGEEVTVTLAPQDPNADIDAQNPFRQTSALGTFACFGEGQARAFLVEQFRFFIEDVPVPGSVDTRPFLFLDRGIGNPVPVAADIEDLQVAYILNNGTEWGVEGSNATSLATGAFAAGGCSHADEVRVPHYRNRAITQCARTCARRNLDHAANIKAVRLTVVARTPTEVRGRNQAIEPHDEHIPSAFSFENRDRSNEPADGFRRVRLTTTIELTNMLSRGIPTI